MRRKNFSVRHGIRPWGRGFTLVELLVVMALIAILMGLLLPAVQKVKNTARQRHAEAEARALETAIRNYHQEYGLWPGPDAGAQGTNVYVNNNDQVIRLLLPSGNPRSIAFWETPGVATNPYTYQPFQITINLDGGVVSVK